MRIAAPLLLSPPAGILPAFIHAICPGACMRRPGIIRMMAYVGVLALCCGTPVLAADDLDALNRQVAELYGQGKYEEAISIAKRALAFAERTRGPMHPETLTSINNLAFLHQAQGRYSAAEPLYDRALAGNEWALGPDHPNTLLSVNNLGLLYQAQGRLAEAEPLLKRALVGYEQALGPDHPDTLRGVNNLGGLYQAQGRYKKAEPLLKRAFAGYERTLGPKHPSTLLSVNNLGLLYQAQGHLAEAEPLLKRALVGYEQALGPDHPDTLRGVNNLGGLYQAQGRHGECEQLFKRSLTGYERTLGPDHLSTLQSATTLAMLHQAQGRYGEAERLFKRALAGNEGALGPKHPNTLMSVNNLGLLYQAQGRYGEAEPLFKRALAGHERALGPDHPRTLTRVNNLGLLYWAQGRYGEAEPLWRRALTGYERALGQEHPDTLRGVNNLAALYFVQRDWTRAAALWRRSTAAIGGRTQRGMQAADQALTGKKKSEAEQLSFHFWRLVKAAYRLTPEHGIPDPSVSREMFQTAQWALSSEAAQSLAQMAARSAKGDGALAALVRERQDLLAEWQRRELLRSAVLGRETVKRDANAETDNNARMAAIDTRIAAIDKTLAAEFADYAALASPSPLRVEEVQAQLSENEALVLFLETRDWKTTPEETFIWVVTKTNMRWVRSDLGTAALAREVRALRCGLDYTTWSDPRCAELMGVQYTQPDSFPRKLLLFDQGRSHRLYKALFSSAEDMIKGKHLLLVPSGALTQLPFQVLITAPPAGGDYRSAAWLARDHALTVLPAVSSLIALRRTSRPSLATRPLIGFGNPLLDGPDDRYAKFAKLAREKQSCAKGPGQRVVALFGLSK